MKSQSLAIKLLILGFITGLLDLIVPAFMRDAVFYIFTTISIIAWVNVLVYYIRTRN